MTTYAKIIYLYFKKQFTIREISELISNELSKYEEFGNGGLTNLEKVQFTVGNEYKQIQKIKYNDTVSDYTPVNGRSIKVINTESGVIYPSIVDAAEKFDGRHHNILREMLNGHRPNTTPLIKYIPQIENNLK